MDIGANPSAGGKRQYSRARVETPYDLQSYSEISHFCGIPTVTFGTSRLNQDAGIWVTRDNERHQTVESEKYCAQRANCTEVGVSSVVLIQLFAVGSLLSALCCCLLEVAMVAEIRRGLAGWQPADLARDIVVTFRSHRRFYPASPLRRAFIVSSVALGFCIAGLVLVYRIAHGMM